MQNNTFSDRNYLIKLANTKMPFGKYKGQFLVDIPEKDFRELKKWAKFLTKEEKSVLKELAELKRKEFPVWGI